MSFSTHVCLLRGINVSGQKMIKMERLRVSFEALGFQQVRTYVQSGNVGFQASAKFMKDLPKTIHGTIQRDFGFDVPVTVLTAKDVMAALKENPFLKEKGIDIAKLHVTFLADVPDKEALKKLAALPAQPDRFHSVGKRIYLHCPDSYGNTKLSNQAIERLLGVSATTRNWKTLNELARMCEEEPRG